MFMWSTLNESKLAEPQGGIGRQKYNGNKWRKHRGNRRLAVRWKVGLHRKDKT